VNHTTLEGHRSPLNTVAGFADCVCEEERDRYMRDGFADSG
jgi:hypothetical protein